jgi:hypothetical protein
LKRELREIRDGGRFRTALEARLKTAQSEHSGLSRLRKRVVFERLLARLNVVAPDGWVLKGGFALELALATTPGRQRTSTSIGKSTSRRAWNSCST